MRPDMQTIPERNFVFLEIEPEQKKNIFVFFFSNAGDKFHANIIIYVIFRYVYTGNKMCLCD